MTLIYEYDLDILEAKNEVSRSRLSKVPRAQTRQTDATEDIRRSGPPANMNLGTLVLP